MSDEYGPTFSAADPMPSRDGEAGAVERAADPVPAVEGAAAVGEEGEKRKRGFPSPLTILAIVIVAVCLLALFIPSGEYQRDDSSAPIPGGLIDPRRE